MKVRLFAMALLLVSGMSLAGCSNTMDGFGRDVERAGQSIQRF